MWCVSVVFLHILPLCRVCLACLCMECVDCVCMYWVLEYGVCVCGLKLVWYTEYYLLFFTQFFKVVDISVLARMSANL